MVPADSDRISLVPPYSGYYTSTLISIYAAFTLYGSAFQQILFDSAF